MKTVTGVLLILAALTAAPLFARETPRFERFDFKLKGEITDIITEDLDGDGLSEAIVVHVDPDVDPPARRLTIFPQAAGQGFDRKNRIEWDFPAEVASIDVGDVSADPGRELVFITEHGISYASVAGGKVGPLQELIQVLSVVAIPFERGVPYYNFVRDYTGDGKDDILVVGFFDALFARQVKDHQFREQRIRLRPRIDIQAWDVGKLLGDSEHPMFRVAYYVPQIFSADTNADGLPDLVVNFRSKVHVFTQDKDGFTTDPAATYNLEIMKEGGSRRGPRQPANFYFSDLDGDGRVDVVATQSKGNFGSMKSRTVLYRGKGDALATNTPSLEFKPEGTVMSLFVRDVNQDGLPDVIMPTMDLGAWSAGKVLVTGGISVKWNFYIQQPGHKFNQLPDREFTTTLKFNIGSFQLESGIPNVFGDFNGDGFPDQAVGEDKDVLVVNLRDGDGAIMGVEERLNVPVSMFNRALDLNNDGLTDILIHYEDQSEHVSEFHVFINRGPWTAQ